MLHLKGLLFVTIMTLYYSVLNANVYDADLLNTYSKLSPRFVLMSTQKLKVKKSIEICLVYDNEDERVAQRFINLMQENYPHGIQNHTIEFIKSSDSNLSVCENSHLLFLFNVSSPTFKSSILFAQKSKIMTISYEAKLLIEGADISLFLGRKVIPYINLKSMRAKEIELDNILLRISKIYTRTQGDEK